MVPACSWEPLEALVMGELDAAEARAVRVHVARCAACAAELAMLTRETSAVRAWARADREGTLSARRERRVRRATWAAAACVALLALSRMHAGGGGDGSRSGDGARTGESSLDMASIDEAWSACLTMTPANAPPPCASLAGDATRRDPCFSPAAPSACE